MQLITHQSDLEAFCARMAGVPYVTVDTEFIRDKTYYPRLCLLQLASPKDAAVIDPLAEGIALGPVFSLMQNEAIPKVFHAARQDIEILYLLSGQIPKPLFDTQIAAAVCGYGESVGYETLVNRIVGAELDKSSRYTDWSARPLTEQQLAYAISDVTHLRVIYETLKGQIEKAGRAAWTEEEHAILQNPAIYHVEPVDAWQRLRYGNMRPKQLAALRELAAWREVEARKADVPRGRIVKDETLVEIASALPRKEADLTRLRGVDKHLSKSRMAALLEGVQRALELAPSEYPQVKNSRRPSENVTSAVAMLQLLLKVQADVHGIASSMITDKDELQDIALGKTDCQALQGWRGDVFGQKAVALMQGKLKLSLNPKNKQVVFEEAE
ncbi:MAG: ribonuclease D [Proteobacteria bacterium]|nr:ribonuclease D [Pseudomonadota bacterium]